MIAFIILTLIGSDSLIVTVTHGQAGVVEELMGVLSKKDINTADKVLVTTQRVVNGDVDKVLMTTQRVLNGDVDA